MATYSGTAANVKTGGGSGTVDEIKEWTLDVSLNVVDVSSFGDVWNENIPSIRSFTGSFSGNYSDLDADQLAFQNKILDGETVTFRFYLNADSYFFGTALVTGHSVSIGYDGAAQLTHNLTGTFSVTFI